MLGITVADVVAIATVALSFLMAWRGLKDGDKARAMKPAPAPEHAILGATMVDTEVFRDVAIVLRELVTVIREYITDHRAEAQDRMTELLEEFGEARPATTSAVAPSTSVEAALMEIRAWARPFCVVIAPTESCQTLPPEAAERLAAELIRRAYDIWKRSQRPQSNERVQPWSRTKSRLRTRPRWPQLAYGAYLRSGSAAVALASG